MDRLASQSASGPWVCPRSCSRQGWLAPRTKPECCSAAPLKPACCLHSLPVPAGEPCALTGPPFLLPETERPLMHCPCLLVYAERRCSVCGRAGGVGVPDLQAPTLQGMELRGPHLSASCLSFQIIMSGFIQRDVLAPWSSPPHGLSFCLPPALPQLPHELGPLPPLLSRTAAYPLPHTLGPFPPLLLSFCTALPFVQV